MRQNLPEFRTIGGRPVTISHDASGSLQVEGRTITRVVPSAQAVVLYCGHNLYLVSPQVYHQIQQVPVVLPRTPEPEPWAELECEYCAAVFRFEGEAGWTWSDEAQEWQHMCQRRR